MKLSELVPMVDPGHDPQHYMDECVEILHDEGWTAEQVAYWVTATMVLSPFALRLRARSRRN